MLFARPITCACRPFMQKELDRWSKIVRQNRISAGN